MSITLNQASPSIHKVLRLRTYMSFDVFIADHSICFQQQSFYTKGVKMKAETKKVFISYSWKVQDKVIELANKLSSNGVEPIVDIYDLKVGQDKYAFMEQSVNDPSVDKVLIICDRSYMDKANNRTGGVGDETVIISPEIYGNIKQEKFIPVVIEFDEAGQAYLPHYLKSRRYIALSDDRYKNEYNSLLLNIYDLQEHKKPALGVKPEWFEDETVDLSAIRDIIKQIKENTAGDTTNAEFLSRKASDEFVNAAKQYVIPNYTDRAIELPKVIDQTKPLRDLFVDYCENLIRRDLLKVVSLPGLFEHLYNELHDTGGKISYHDGDFELYDYMIWEFFICATAVLLKHERFAELRQLLTATYFLKIVYSSSSVVVPQTFKAFLNDNRVIEDECKPQSKNPRLLTLAGEILVNREMQPILTRETIANADIVLYQLSEIFNLPDNMVWFPKTYVYHQRSQLLWARLNSKSYCKKIFPLFSVNTINDLKEILKGTEGNQVQRHPCYPFAAPSILSSIALDQIGTLE